MKSSLAVVAVCMTVAIAGCDTRAKSPAADATPASPETVAPTAVLPAEVAATTPAAARADGTVPDFAVVYPAAEIEGDPLVATSDTGPGGVVTFTTDAPPETVIAFYRERAEAAGLATMMSLNQGQARAYGALKQTNGASVNVVAAPAEDRTSVQLTWSAGQ